MCAVSQVNLHLQFSVFSGYGEAGFLSSYLGVQAHGILWPAAGIPAPAIWPVTPPVVSAKASRRQFLSSFSARAQPCTLCRS